MTKITTVLLFAILALIGGTASAQTPTSQPAKKANYQWDYALVRDPDAGLNNCLMYADEASPASTPGSVNVVVTKLGGGKVEVKGELGKTITVKLICQKDSSYTSSLGAGLKVGRATPATSGTDSTPGDHPEGMLWHMLIGTQQGQPFTATFTGSGSWGSNTLTLTTVPFAAPATTEYVDQKAKSTADSAVAEHASDLKLHTGHSNVFGLGVSYVHSLDSDDGRPRNGFGGFMEGYIPVFGKESPFRLSVGVNVQHDYRFKPVRNVPNLQPVGSHVDWASTYIGPHIGINVIAPPSNNIAFAGNLKLSLGLWHFADGTVPLSQQANSKLVQVGPAEQENAFAGKISLSAGVVIYKTVSLLLDLSYTQAFSEITLFRGPADTTTYGRPTGRIGDWGLGPSIQATF